MVLTAFKQEVDAYTEVPKLFFVPTLDGFKAVFDQGVGTALLNSLFATTVSTILVLALGIPAAFALSLKPVLKTQDALFFFMSTKMLPVVAAIIPLYVIVSNIGLLDNIWALIILYTSMNLPIAVWMMRSFFLEVPGELLEAASLDGASTWRAVREVILPLVSPGIAATALICVIFAWNEFFFAVSLTAVQAQTMPVFLVGFIAGQGLYWAKLCAAATMAALPVDSRGLDRPEQARSWTLLRRHQVRKANTPMATITYKNASCIYEGSDKLAVDSLNLDIQDGEFVVLVGPSGSGKSTALRMLAGLEDIDEGNIEIGGKDMVGVPSKDRDIAMVFQNYALYPNKTVAENMGFALKLRGVSADERRRKVEDAAKLLDLSEFLDRKPAKLSGGQRQRVAMGRAIVRNPQVFCMDEPLSNLDAKLRVQTRTQIAALQRRLGTTTVYVTHDQVEAMTMGDRVAVLRNGKLQQFASPNELYDKPENAFVAGFIGSPAMNLVTLPITAEGVRVGDNSTLELERDQLSRLHDAGLEKVTFGIRPEQLDIADSGGVEVVVDLVEDLGSEAYVYTHAGSGVELVARSTAKAAPKLAQTVHLRKHPDGVVHLFHPETGERIG